MIDIFKGHTFKHIKSDDDLHNIKFIDRWLSYESHVFYYCYKCHIFIGISNSTTGIYEWNDLSNDWVYQFHELLTCNQSVVRNIIK